MFKWLFTIITIVLSPALHKLVTLMAREAGRMAQFANRVWPARVPLPRGSPAGVEPEAGGFAALIVTEGSSGLGPSSTCEEDAWKATWLSP